MIPEELQRLVDEERIDELFEAVTLEDMAAAWWRYALAEGDKEDHPDWWAVDVWFVTAFAQDEARRRAAILALIERAPADADLGYVGAGPLEVFVCGDEDCLRWVEENASQSEQFRTALANVWVGENEGAWTERLDRAAGVTLTRVP